MTKTTKRTLLGRGKGYLNAAGTQSRFIIFLLFVLMAYTLLMRVFQKLAQILQLPVFLPISLITLLVFIGVVGTVYSHAFAGPLGRIRKAVDQLAQGDLSVSLRLRESDDPLLKELVDAITRVCDHSRNAHTLIHASAEDLFSEINALREAVRNADRAEIPDRIEAVRRKQELMQKALQSLGHV